MNTKTAKTTLAILSIVALLTAVTASSIATTAFASQEEDGKKGGPATKGTTEIAKETLMIRFAKRNIPVVIK
jgi:hypothetical protein